DLRGVLRRERRVEGQRAAPGARGDRAGDRRARRRRGAVNLPVAACPPGAGLCDCGAALEQQRLERAAVAAALVLAVAAYREVRAMGQRREQVERAAGVRRGHLPPIGAEEAGPVLRCPGGVRELHGRRRRREVGIPDVVPVTPGELRARHAARRPPHRADAKPLVAGPRRAEPHDPYRHAALPRRSSWPARTSAAWTWIAAQASLAAYCSWRSSRRRLAQLEVPIRLDFTRRRLKSTATAAFTPIERR